MSVPDSPHPQCPDCHHEMVQGWLHERGDARAQNTLQVYWEEGDAKKFWLGGYKSTGKDLPVTAWRCSECGLLRHYANE